MNKTAKVPPKQRLTAERTRRRWTQLQVADQLGTTPGNVSRWERGITSPSPYFRSKLCELFGMSAHDLGLSWNASEDLVQVQTLVGSSTTAARPHAQTHTGRGGNSSAQTALEAACGSREDYAAVLWVKANPREVGQEGLARLMGGLNRPEQPQEWLEQAVTHRLHIHPDWMLVLDNVQEVTLVVEVLPLNATVNDGPLNLVGSSPVDFEVAVASPVDLELQTSVEDIDIINVQGQLHEQNATGSISVVRTTLTGSGSI